MSRMTILSMGSLTIAFVYVLFLFRSTSEDLRDAVKDNQSLQLELRNAKLLCEDEAKCCSDYENRCFVEADLNSEACFAAEEFVATYDPHREAQRDVERMLLDPSNYEKHPHSCSDDCLYCSLERAYLNAKKRDSDE